MTESSNPIAGANNNPTSIPPEQVDPTASPAAAPRKAAAKTTAATSNAQSESGAPTKAAAKKTPVKKSTPKQVAAEAKVLEAPVGSDRFSTMAARMQPTLEAIRVSMAAGAHSFREFAEPVLDKVEDAVKPVVGQVEHAVKPYAKQAGAAVGPYVEQVEQAVKPIVDTAVARIAEAGHDFADTAAEFRSRTSGHADEAKQRATELSVDLRVRADKAVTIIRNVVGR
jgi:hypothetical protein